MNLSQIYVNAAEVIKTAILKGQYASAIGINRTQLATYFSVGRYISRNTREGVWGTGALELISEQLQKMLPGLKGYGASQMKNMRMFYEEWNMLDAKSSDSNFSNSPFTNGELQTLDNEIDIFHSLYIPDLFDFPTEDFFRVPFTHHCRILEKVKNSEARYYYIHRCAEEHMTVDGIKKSIEADDYHHQSSITNNFKSTLPKSELARKAVLAFKDEYLLNYINIEEIGERDWEDVDERVVEQQIVNNIKKFIMTFGHDFTFVGNQYRMEIYG